MYIAIGNKKTGKTYITFKNLNDCKLFNKILLKNEGAIFECDIQGQVIHYKDDEFINFVFKNEKINKNYKRVYTLINETGSNIYIHMKKHNIAAIDFDDYYAVINPTTNIKLI